ncbi:PocR ligand-binding domain-containing protein [Pseudomonadota bacterium]
MKGDIRIVRGEVDTLPELPDFLKEKSQDFRRIYTVLKQLLDSQRINQLLRDFHEMVGVPVAIIDIEANVLASSSWMRICTDFHRVNPGTCARCLESDTELANQLEKGSQFTMYQCKNGLTDCASPIVIEGEHIANLFIGQFLLKQPDRDFFEQQAKAFGFPLDDYLEALAEVPIVAEERLAPIMSFLVNFAQLIAQMGLEKLREQQYTLSARFGRIVENSLNEIYVFDADSLKFNLVNKGARNNLGYSMEELEKMTPLDIKPNFTPEGFEETIQPLRNGKLNSLFFETVHKRKDSSLYNVEVHLQLMSDEKPPVFAAIIQDITERKKTEEVLKESEKNQEWLLSNLPAAVVVHDAKSVIQYCNSTALEILGLTLDQAMGRDAFDPAWHFIREDNSVMPFEEYPANKVIATKQALHNLVVGVVRHADEAPIWVLVRAFPDVDQDGYIKRVVVSFVDITEHKRMEQLMVQTEKMMSVGGLAAGMAHELNNPLGGIIQGIQNVQRRISPDFEKNIQIANELGIDLEKVEEYLTQRDIVEILSGINSAGSRAAEIVNNMLKFARKPEAELKPEALTPLIDQALQLAEVDYSLKKEYDFREIEIVKEYDPTVNSVMCIAPEIQQVLLNLLKNAAQALSDRDKDIEPRITLRTHRHNNMICIEVEDNGPGMDEHTRSRVFDPFFTTRPVGEGTGLGLSVSYFIITQEHNGQISVDSAPGHGTTFKVCLPML